MISICLNKQAIKGRYKSLQEKYNASEGALDHAIYSWANANEDRVKREGDIDVDSAELEDYLDRYFKVKSDNVFSNKKEYDRAIKIFNTIAKTVWNDKKEATERYNKYVALFGAENAVIYKTPDGKYIVRLARPEISSDLEMQSIKDKAIADGTFMKAPNGKPTNLTERQWLQVRTKSFKNWFGDWEAVNTFNIDNVDTSEIDVVSDDKKWRKREDGKHIDENGNWRSNKVLRFYLKGEHEKGYFELVKDDEFGAFSVHFLTFNGKEGDPKFATSTREDRAKMYKALLEALPKGATISTWGELSDGGFYGVDKIGRLGNMTKVGTRDVHHKEKAGNFKVNVWQRGQTVSQVVDENGEPLVVYHGTAKNFDIFKADIDNHGAFFTSDKNYAINVAKYQNSNIVLPVFLNIKNLKETNTPLVKGVIDDLYWEEAFNGGKTPDGIKGHDLITDEFEFNSNGTEYVVFKPNQIKSATDNNGEFSREDDNIYNEEESTEKVNITKEVKKLPPVLQKKVNDSLNARKFEKSTGDTKHWELINLYFTGNKNYQKNESLSSEELIDSIIKNTDSEETRALAKRIKANMAVAGKVKVIFAATSGVGPLGTYKAHSHSIHIYDRAARGDSYEHAKRAMERTMLHEISHSITVARIEQDPNVKAEVREIMDELESYISNQDIKWPYALKNEAEFIAEFMSEPTFREALKFIPSKKNKTVWQRIVDFIAKVLTGDTKGTLFEDAENLINNMLETNTSSFFEKLESPDEFNDEDTVTENKSKTVTYTPVGKTKQTYTIKGNKIFNKDGKEVFATDSKDRRKVFAKLAIKENRAVVVDHKDKKYIVNDKGKILSVSTGNFVWENSPENGDRKAILEAAKQKFGNTSDFQWARSSSNSFEVSTAANNDGVVGDSRFSALNAKFKQGTIIDGVDVSGMTIENVYQSVIKKSGKGKAPSKDSRLYIPTKEEIDTPEGRVKASKLPHKERIIDVYNNVDHGFMVIVKSKTGTSTAEISFNHKQNRWRVDLFDESNPERQYLSLEKQQEVVDFFIPKDLQEYFLSGQNAKDDKALMEETDKVLPLSNHSIEERVKYQNEVTHTGSAATLRDRWGVYHFNEWTGENNHISQNLSKTELEDFSYREGYLPLWQEWARQNPELMQELREKAAGKVLTDKFAKTRVSQARALAEILNSQQSSKEIKFTKEPAVNQPFYEGDITPDDNTIFVFGSNPEGRHGAGAAKVAREQFGAQYGVGEGLTGNAYALPTKDLRVKENKGLRSISRENIIKSIKKLYETARTMPDKQFKIAYRNTDKASLNGYTGYEMIEMFKEAGAIPSNIIFSKEWYDTGKLNQSSKDNLTEEEAIVKWLGRDNISKAFKEFAEDAETVEDVVMNAANAANSEKNEKRRKSFMRAIKGILKYESTRNIIQNYLSDKEDEENTLVNEAKEKLNAVREELESRIRFDKKSHIYTVYPSAKDKKNNKNGTEAISVTTYLHGKLDVGDWGIPSNALGNTNDAVIRDFFRSKMDKNFKMKSSYPNMTKSQLQDMIDDCEVLFDYFKKTYGNNCVIITEEFPIAAQYTKMVKGKPVVSYMAGTMDMIIIDQKGKYHGLDMKAIRSSLDGKKLQGYGNQLGLYNGILSSYGIEFEDTKLIKSDVYYDGPINVKRGAGDAVYTVDDNGQLYDKGKKIQSVKGYKAPRLALENFGSAVVEGKDGNNTIIPVRIDKNTREMAKELEALSPEERALAEEEFGSKIITSQSSSITYGNRKTSAKSGLYNPLLSASERKFLANQVMQQASFIVTHLQTSKEANNGKNGYFSDGTFANINFTAMSREDIIKTVGVGRLFKLVHDNILEPAMLNAEDENIFKKYEIAYDNFGDLINEGYSKFISLEGFTVVELAEKDNIIIDMGDENVVDDNDASTLEEKEREYWQLGQRQISAKSSLSKEIRRMFERLKVLDENGNPVKDKFGFGLDTFVDADTAVNNILDWCRDCTTIEEMEEILAEKAESNPYLNTILEKIQDEPTRSMFFKNFRKDFTVYSIVQVETDSNGKKSYVVHTVNTQGAGATLLSNLTKAFQSGNMQNLIITRDTVEGRGIVNVKKVEAILREKEAIVKRLDAASGNKKKLAKVIEKESVNITTLLNKLGIQVLSSTVYATIKKDADISDMQNTYSIKLLNKIGHIANTLLQYKNLKGYNPMLKEQEEGNLYSTYRDMVNILEKNIEHSIEASTYENGKMYYSFVTPSYMGKLITNLKDAKRDSAKFKKFIKDNYGKYRWFYDRSDPENPVWNNVWLEQIAMNKEAREKLEHKVQLHFGKTPYDELSELGYTQSLMQEYFYDKGGRWAWYRLPILSNKPSSEFVRFIRYSGKSYKTDIKKGLKKVFEQEVLRIQTVLERAALAADSGVNKIEAYDIDLEALQDYLKEDKSKKLIQRIKKKAITAKDLVDIMRAMQPKGKHSGAEFRFLEALNNEFVKNTELAQLIVGKINDKDIDVDTLDALLIGKRGGRNEDGAIDTYMKKIVSREIRQWESIGLFDTVEIKKKDKNGNVTTTEEYKYLSNLGKTKEEIMGNLEEYVWNDMFATINIIQLTATDLAYYKNMEDFQKRYAQVHSPTLKLNATAEYDGVRVSDGNLRTIYIKDYKIKSEIIPNVKEIFDRKIASIKNPSERKQMIQMRDLILSNFEKINVTDAQGYSSPTSYRKKMVMAGSWDKKMEEAYQRIASGKYDVNDLGVVWQPLKPFVYTQIGKTTGVKKMSEIKVPIQNKNSEYMLLLADALMRGAGKKSTLGAIFDFMEESHLERDEKGNPIKGTYRQDGIDTVQFESAVKSGLMGVIDINNKSYKDIKKTLEDAVYYSSNKQGSTKNDMDRYNDQFVHAIPVEDYGIQQEVPAHLLDHMQAMGSQIRILSISDISEDARFNVNGKKGSWDRDYLINRYQELHAANIKESFDDLAREFKLKGKNRKKKNKALSKILIEAIKKDQRYGSDLIRACSLDKNDEFIIPLNDPIQSQRIQQLINSIIKSRINKQEVLGGPVVQASVFGMSDDLHIVFQDKNGDPLRAKKEGESDAQYKKYLSENQASMSHMEVYMPIPSTELEKALTKEDGTIMDVEEAVDNGIISEEMLKAICYRIPTEDKYSMIPVKIKGFLPKAAGEAIMMPKEITLLTGSDFDIDKMYVMLKEFTPNKVNINKFTEAVIKSYAKKHSKTEVKRDSFIIADMIKELDKYGRIKSEYGGNHIPTLQRQIEAIWRTRSQDYRSSFVENTVGNLGKENRSTRNNEIFDIQWAVLTHEDTMSKMFNPGSFDIPKKSSRIIRALKAGVDKSYEELAAMDSDDINNLLTSDTGNIIFSTTQVAFHKQNMTAGKLIGIFANNNTSHAFLSMQHIHLNLGTDDAGFTIDGHTVGESENNELDKQKAFDGSLISKNIASFLAASVDAVKDPVLNFMNLNTFTAGPAMVLARLGFDTDTIGLLLTQPIIEKVTREYFRQNNDGYVSVEDIIKQELDDGFREWKKMEQNVSAIDFTKDRLAKGITEGIDFGEDQIMALLLFKRLAGIAKSLNDLTFLTKFNSVSNAVGPTIADTFVLQERFSKFLQDMESDKPPFSNNAKKVIDNSPILKAFYEKTIGDGGASHLIFGPYFPHYSPKFKDELLPLIRETTKARLDAKTINRLINEFILYKLTAGNNPIINSSYEQRNRFINNFVEEFKERAEGIVDNDLIDAITIEYPGRYNKCPVTVLNAKTGGFSVDMQEKIRTAWSTLMENPETFELGRDLFIYNLYRNGFTFSPKTFIHLASVDTKLAMGDYIDAVADTRFNDNRINVAEFLLMFRRNHSTDTKIVPSLKLEKEKGGTRISATTSKDGRNKLTISYKKEKDGLDGIIARRKPTSIVFAPVIEYNGKLYYTENYEREGSSGSITYIETTPLGNKNNFIEYNANESAAGMVSVLKKKKKGKKDKDEDEDERQDTPDSEGSSRSDDYVNYDNDSQELITDEEYRYLYNQGPLAEYTGEIAGIAAAEGEEAASARTIELAEKFVAETDKKKAKEKVARIIKDVKERLKKFCK